MRDAMQAGAKVPYPYYLKLEARTDKRFLRLVRNHMVLLGVRKDIQNPQGDGGREAAYDFSGDEGGASGGGAGSDGSADDGPDTVAQALRSAVGALRDELPIGGAVEGAVPGSDAWASATA